MVATQQQLLLWKVEATSCGKQWQILETATIWINLACTFDCLRESGPSLDRYVIHVSKVLLLNWFVVKANHNKILFITTITKASGAQRNQLNFKIFKEALPSNAAKRTCVPLGINLMPQHPPLSLDFANLCYILTEPLVTRATGVWRFPGRAWRHDWSLFFRCSSGRIHL